MVIYIDIFGQVWTDMLAINNNEEIEDVVKKPKLITVNCNHGEKGTNHCAVMYPSKKYPCGKNCPSFKPRDKKKPERPIPEFSSFKFICVDCGEKIDLPSHRINTNFGEKWLCDDCKRKNL